MNFRSSEWCNISLIFPHTGREIIKGTQQICNQLTHNKSHKCDLILICKQILRHFTKRKKINYISLTICLRFKTMVEKIVGVFISQPCICVARGMRELNGEVRMRSTERDNLAPLSQWGGRNWTRSPTRLGRSGKSLFTESRLLLKHIPFQSIRSLYSLPPVLTRRTL